MISEVTVDWQD